MLNEDGKELGGEVGVAVSERFVILIGEDERVGSDALPWIL